MKVKFIKKGFVNNKRINIGDIVEIDPKYFSDKCMEKYEEKKKVITNPEIDAQVGIEKLEQAKKKMNRDVL